MGIVGTLVKIGIGFFFLILIGSVIGLVLVIIFAYDWLKKILSIGKIDTTSSTFSSSSSSSEVHQFDSNGFLIPNPGEYVFQVGEINPFTQVMLRKFDPQPIPIGHYVNNPGTVGYWNVRGLNYYSSIISTPTYWQYIREKATVGDYTTLGSDVVLADLSSTIPAGNYLSENYYAGQSTGLSTDAVGHDFIFTPFATITQIPSGYYVTSIRSSGIIYISDYSSILGSDYAFAPFTTIPSDSYISVVGKPGSIGDNHTNGMLIAYGTLGRDVQYTPFSPIPSGYYVSNPGTIGTIPDVLGTNYTITEITQPQPPSTYISVLPVIGSFTSTGNNVVYTPFTQPTDGYFISRAGYSGDLINGTKGYDNVIDALFSSLQDIQNICGGPILANQFQIGLIPGTNQPGISTQSSLISFWGSSWESSMHYLNPIINNTHTYPNLFTNTLIPSNPSLRSSTFEFGLYNSVPSIQWNDYFRRYFILSFTQNVNVYNIINYGILSNWGGSVEVNFSSCVIKLPVIGPQQQMYFTLNNNYILSNSVLTVRVGTTNYADSSNSSQYTEVAGNSLSTNIGGQFPNGSCLIWVVNNASTSSFSDVVIYFTTLKESSPYYGLPSPVTSLPTDTYDSLLISSSTLIPDSSIMSIRNNPNPPVFNINLGPIFTNSLSGIMLLPTLAASLFTFNFKNPNITSDSIIICSVVTYTRNTYTGKFYLHVLSDGGGIQTAVCKVSSGECIIQISNDSVGFINLYFNYNIINIKDKVMYDPPSSNIHSLLFSAGSAGTPMGGFRQGMCDTCTNARILAGGGAGGIIINSVSPPPATLPEDVNLCGGSGLNGTGFGAGGGGGASLVCSSGYQVGGVGEPGFVCILETFSIITSNGTVSMNPGSYTFIMMGGGGGGGNVFGGSSGNIVRISISFIITTIITITIGQGGAPAQNGGDTILNIPGGNTYIAFGGKASGSGYIPESSINTILSSSSLNTNSALGGGSNQSGNIVSSILINQMNAQPTFGDSSSLGQVINTIITPGKTGFGMYNLNGMYVPAVSSNNHVMTFWNYITDSSGAHHVQQASNYII